MNIRDLQYLVAVADTKHFGQAADRCCVSQPTLSAQIKKLEEELGVMLFERTNKQVMITAIGEKIIAKANQVLGEVKQMKQVAAQAQDPLAGEIHIGIIPTMGPYLLPALLPALQQQLPKLELIVVENKTDHILKALQQGLLDAVILALPVPTDGLVVKSLFNDPFWIAMSPDHRLSQRKRIAIEELEQESLLLLEEGHCLRDQALEVCNMLGSQEKNGFKATSLETLRHLVAAGRGITLLPNMALTATQAASLTCRPFKKPIPSREVAMLWREGSARAECCTAISQLMVEIASAA